MPTRINTAQAAPSHAHDRQLQDHARPPGWNNPKPAARYHLVVIGAGPAGLAAAKMAVTHGATVALIERRLVGGGCLNTGCIPSKTLIRTARLYAEMRDARRYGARVPEDIHVDFAAAMDRVRQVRAHLSGGDSTQRLAAMGVHVFFGEASFTGFDSLTVNGETLRFRKALVATGGRPDVPNVPGLAQAGYLSSETVFDLAELPRRLLVIGGSPLGCELAQAFCRLGAHTTIVQDLPLFLPLEERDAALILSDALARDGIQVRLNTNAIAVRVENGQKSIDLVSDDYHNTIQVDAILTGVGRLPNVEGLNLQAAGIECDAGDGIRTDDFLRTGNPDVYAAGDVCLEHRYTHTARASARIAVHNALLRGRERLSELVVPWCTYTDPEIAHVGMYVREANRQDIPVKTFTIPMHEVDRAVTDGDDEGFVKIHVREGTDRILGATIVARDAGEIINEIALAMVAGVGLRTLARVLHAYPTQASAIGMAADAYQRTRLTERIRARLRRWMP